MRKNRRKGFLIATPFLLGCFLVVLRAGQRSMAENRVSILRDQRESEAEKQMLVSDFRRNSNNKDNLALVGTMRMDEKSGASWRLGKKQQVTARGDAKRSCQESGIGNLSHVHFQHTNNLSEFLQGPGLKDNSSSSNIAVCEFQRNEHSGHFPHAMQQLYRCWSWWQSNPSKRPILVLPYQKRHNRNPFLAGFLQSLRDIFGVTVVATNSTSSITKPSQSWGGAAAVRYKEVSAYAMYSPKHARILRDGILSNRSTRERDSVAGAECPYSQANRSLVIPRIAILNRKTKRSLLNAEAILRSLHNAFSSSSSSANNPSGLARIVYLEDQSFIDQVRFFSSVDLLISPHGAQLTGLAFMPSCGSVLELFPKGFLLPDFFGSLALAAGLRHSYLYLSAGDAQQETAAAMKERKTRVGSRNANLCPPLDIMVDAVRHLVDQWRQCCLALPE